MLRTRGLNKSFGGISAIDDVDFHLEEELCSLIGPNGAGKTTFFNLLTGELAPDSGTIELKKDGGWVDITDSEPYKTASLGLHRSYQINNTFNTSTVLENVRIAIQAKSSHSFKVWRNVHSFDDSFERAYRILDRVGLEEQAEMPAENLSHGEKRQLEMAITIAGDPSVVLLDEPNAGVTSESVDEIIELIEDVAKDYTVLLVEHNMDIVMNVSDRIVVLDQGKVIANGKPEDIEDNPRVQEAYLGGYEYGQVATERTTEGTDDFGNN